MAETQTEISSLNHFFSLVLCISISETFLGTLNDSLLVRRIPRSHGNTNGRTIPFLIIDIFLG